VVRFCGEEVAAVAAISEEIARDALDLIRIEYEELPAVLLPEEALDEEAPNMHDGRKDNIAHEIRFERGSVDEGLCVGPPGARSHLHDARAVPGLPGADGHRSPCSTRKGAWSCGRPRNPPSSPARAWPRRWSGPCPRPRDPGDDRGRLRRQDRRGRQQQLVAGLLAVKTGKPVRLVNNRLEDFLACPTSLPERITLKLGMTRDGLIVAKDVRIVADCGAYAGLSSEVMHVSAMRSDNMHRLKNVRSHATAGLHPHAAARRLPRLRRHADAVRAEQPHRHDGRAAGPGPGRGAQASTPSERARCRCTAGRSQHRAASNASTRRREALRWGEPRKSGAPGGSKRRGVGMAAAMHVSGNRTIGNWDGSTVVLKVNEDGRVVVHSGEGDMGQGAMTMLAQIVAHELDIPLGARARAWRPTPTLRRSPSARWPRA
jgi:CO/xanthine dehydrogenase Mo-binding subunit